MEEIKLGSVTFSATKKGGLGILGKFAIGLPNHAVIDHFINGYFTDSNNGVIVLPKGREALQAIWTPQQLEQLNLTSEQMYVMSKFVTF